MEVCTLEGVKDGGLYSGGCGTVEGVRDGGLYSVRCHGWRTVLWRVSRMEDCALEGVKDGGLCSGGCHGWRTVLWRVSRMEDCTLEGVKDGELLWRVSRILFICLFIHDQIISNKHTQIEQ